MVPTVVHSLLINAGDPPASDASLDCRRQASGSALLAGVMRERALMRYNAALRKATAMHSMSINAAYDIDVITGHFSRLMSDDDFFLHLSTFNFYLH